MIIRYLAGAAEAAGTPEETVHYGDGLTLGQLRDKLAQEHGPELAEVLGRSSLLVDGERPQDGELVGENATIDVVPAGLDG